MSNIKKIGTVGYWDIGRDDEGDLCLLLDVRAEYPEVFYLSVAGQFTLEERLAEIRAACSDPRDRVIAAARRLAATGVCEDDYEDFDALVSAVQALDEQEDADDES